MNKWLYNKEKHQVDEQPTMGKPSFYDSKDKSTLRDLRQKRWDEYKAHIASLRHIHVSGEVKWKDKEDVTGKFRIESKKFYNNAIDEMNDKYFMKDIAIPQKDPLLKAIDNMLDKGKEFAAYLENQSQEQPKQEAKPDKCYAVDVMKQPKELCIYPSCHCHIEGVPFTEELGEYIDKYYPPKK